MGLVLQSSNDGGEVNILSILTIWVNDLAHNAEGFSQEAIADLHEAHALEQRKSS
jgi:hypothetical protein